MTPTPAAIRAELARFEAYYLATRPLARQIDPQLLRRLCAEILLDHHRRHDVPLTDPE